MPSNRCKVHKYKRITLDRNKNPVYKCIRCPSYTIESLVVGNQCECWLCGETFVMTEKTLLLKPNCGCKNAGIKTSKIRGKKTDPVLESVKSDLLDHLMSKLPS